MEGINQVASVQHIQAPNNARKYVLPAAICLGVGGLAGYSEHRQVASKIAEAAAKCDEALIRKNLAKFWHFENGVPESCKKFFEDVVKGDLSSAKDCLERTKKFYKGSALQAGLVATAVMAFAFGTVSLVRNLINQNKKEV